MYYACKQDTCKIKNAFGTKLFDCKSIHIAKWINI